MHRTRDHTDVHGRQTNGRSGPGFVLFKAPRVRPSDTLRNDCLHAFMAVSIASARRKEALFELIDTIGRFLMR